MHKNITFSDLNVESYGENNNWSNQLLSKIGIGIIEFLVSSILFCYGIILAECVLLGEQTHVDVLWTTLVFICSWSFTDPIARFITDYFEDGKYIFCKYVIGISTSILFGAIMIPHNVTVYALFGGIFSNLISNQLTNIAIEKLDIDHKIYESGKQISKALALFVMPHVIFYLTSNYEVNQAKLIFAAILLNIIPASLLIRGDDDKFRNKVPDMTRYQTLGRYAYQGTELQNFGITTDQKMETKSSSSSESLNSTQDNNRNSDTSDNVKSSETHYSPVNSKNTAEHVNAMFEEHFVTSDGELPTPLNHDNVVSYYQQVGVSILPGIPEENEEDSEDLNKINSKRLSRISVKLEELAAQEIPRRESLAEKVYKFNQVLVEQPDKIDNIEFIPNFRQEKSKSFFEELKYFNKSKNCWSCTPYQKYVWSRRFRSLKDFFLDNFLKPLYYALKTLYFYPALTSRLLTNLIPTLYITLAPFMALERHWKQKKFFTTENATFLLTYVAFAWCFFLLALPLVSKLSNSRVKMLYIFGLGVSGTSLLTLAGKLTNDVITISSLLFGVGHGIVSYAEKIVFRMSLGIRAWHMVRGPLEVISASLIIIIYYVIYVYRLDLHTLLFLAGVSYYLNAIVWCICPLLKFFVGKFRSILGFGQNPQDEFL